jgi:hypothetical protein
MPGVYLCRVTYDVMAYGDDEAMALAKAKDLLRAGCGHVVEAEIVPEPEGETEGAEVAANP